MNVKISNDAGDFGQRVERIVEEKIRPRLKEHDGDLYVKEVRDGSVWVVFTGACKTCPMAQFTIRDVVEKVLRDTLGEALNEVHLFHETSAELLDFARNLLRKKQHNGLERKI